MSYLYMISESGSSLFWVIGRERSVNESHINWEMDCKSANLDLINPC